MEIPEDAMAGADDGRRFALHEEAERIGVTKQDSINRPASFLVDRRVGGDPDCLSFDRPDSNSVRSPGPSVQTRTPS